MRKLVVLANDLNRRAGWAVTSMRFKTCFETWLGEYYENILLRIQYNSFFLKLFRPQPGIKAQVTALARPGPGPGTTAA